MNYSKTTRNVVSTGYPDRSSCLPGQYRVLNRSALRDDEYVTLSRGGLSDVYERNEKHEKKVRKYRAVAVSPGLGNAVKLLPNLPLSDERNDRFHWWGGARLGLVVFDVLTQTRTFVYFRYRSGVTFGN